jgi:hypothetical protein
VARGRFRGRVGRSEIGLRQMSGHRDSAMEIQGMLLQDETYPNW